MNPVSLGNINEMKRTFGIEVPASRAQDPGTVPFARADGRSECDRCRDKRQSSVTKARKSGRENPSVFVSFSSFDIKYDRAVRGLNT